MNVPQASINLLQNCYVDDILTGAYVLQSLQCGLLRNEKRLSVASILLLFDLAVVW